MREIKFRAWDKVAKKFLHPWPDGFHILGETTCFDMIGMQLKERNPEKTVLEMLNDVEIMQFTGLKDKNGKEIYEGDIVRHLARPDGADTTFRADEDYIVKYRPGCFVQQRGYVDMEPSDPYEQIDWEWDRLEVIGNIHQHPNLLEQDNDAKNSR